MNKFKKIILNNGIPLYLLVAPSMKQTIFSYNVNYGSSGDWFNFNYNGEDYRVTSGYAHYLEHLLSEHSKFGDICEANQRRMNTSNAYTAPYVTSYRIVGRNDMEKSIEDFIIAYEEPVFTHNDIESSRHAIETEATSYVDDSATMLNHAIERNLYSGFEKYDETLSPIGDGETTRMITEDNLHTCYNAFYNDENKFLLLAGNVDEERIVDLLNNVYAKIRPHKSSLILPTIDYSGIRQKYVALEGKTEVSLSSLGIKIRKPDNMSMKEFFYYMSILQGYLIESQEYNELNKKGLIDTFECMSLGVVGNYINLIQTFSTPDRDTSIGKLLEIINKKDISPEEYELLQKGIIASEIRNLEDKYSYLEYFPSLMHVTQSYCDADFYRSCDYERFRRALEGFDFDNYVTGDLVKLTRKKKGE